VKHWVLKVSPYINLDNKGNVMSTLKDKREKYKLEQDKMYADTEEAVATILSDLSPDQFVDIDELTLKLVRQDKIKMSRLSFPMCKNDPIIKKLNDLTLDYRGSWDFEFKRLRMRHLLDTCEKLGVHPVPGSNSYVIAELYPTREYAKREIKDYLKTKDIDIKFTYWHDDLWYAELTILSEPVYDPAEGMFTYLKKVIKRLLFKYNITPFLMRWSTHYFFIQKDGYGRYIR